LGAEERVAPAGIPGSSLPGPYPVGDYAAALRSRLRAFAKVQVAGEVVNVKATGARVYFELRDGRGALPCAMWRADFDALRLPEGAVADGTQVVAAGGCDFYPGSQTASPAFSFQVTDLRVAGEGDLLARIEQLRRALVAEGLTELQKALPRPVLPRTIGVVTGETGKARDDVLAGLRRRGWAGRVIWAFAPVQDRRAAPRITGAVQDLAALEEVELIVVARGGGSLTDLMAFSDETLCRTVALLRVPVIASVGHHTDRTLLDDVAAVSCSTPTHAAESAVPLHVGEARSALTRCTGRLAAHGRRAILDRARLLVSLSRAPAEHVARHRARLHQQLRELRASARRRGVEERALAERRLLVLRRKSAAAVADCRAARRRHLESLALALAAHDPQRALERGYALVSDRRGEPTTSAAAARRARELNVRFADGTVPARIDEEPR
jgi:exodeoxyribonuclease VII large subunit